MNGICKAAFSATPFQGFRMFFATISRSSASLHSGLYSSAPPALYHGTEANTPAAARQNKGLYSEAPQALYGAKQKTPVAVR
jgi:hypothetical protein